MPTSLETIYKAIGSLEAEVGALRRDIKNEAEAVEKNLTAAANSRFKLHQGIEDVVARTGELEGSLELVQSDMASVKAVTTQVTAWKHAGMGALGATGLASGAIAAGLVSYWDALKQLIFKS